MFLPITTPKLTIHISCETDSWVIMTGMMALNRGTCSGCYLKICFYKTRQSGWKTRTFFYYYYFFSNSPVPELLSGTLANNKGLASKWWILTVLLLASMLLLEMLSAQNLWEASYQEAFHHQSVGIIVVFLRAYENNFSTKHHWEKILKEKKNRILEHSIERQRAAKSTS